VLSGFGMFVRTAPLWKSQRPATIRYGVALLTCPEVAGIGGGERGEGYATRAIGGG